MAVCLATLALAVSAAPVAGAGATRPCGPAPAETLAQNATVRVYEQRDLVYACMRGTHRRRALGTTYCYGSSSGCHTVREVAVAGRFVAYAIQDDGNSYGDEYFSLDVLDMRQRRVREHHQVGDYGTFNARIARIVLRPTGSAAWLWERWRRSGPRERVVTRSTRCGAPTTLAEGPGVDPRTLRREGSRVFWRDGGEPRRATLC